MWNKEFLIITSITFTSILLSCNKKQEYYETSGQVFKTGFHIKYKYRHDLGKEIEDCLKKVDISLNPFNPNSIIYKVNNNIEVEVDDIFITVFKKAMEVAEESGGMYDITCAPLVNFWGFGFERTCPVTENLSNEVKKIIIDSIMQFVGYQKVRLIERRIIKDDPRIQLNASSIAKGYACDLISNMMDLRNITDYMVEIGGEVRASGKNVTGKCWRIEISKPIEDRTGRVNERLEVLELCNHAIATSGNYRNYRLIGGKKYGHTINPLTGYPAEGNILSASVIAADCMTADAFATAFMVMDLNAAVDLAKRIGKMDFIFVYSNDQGDLNVLKSDSIKR
jgi:thiamine biosynthesis lipoprotein